MEIKDATVCEHGRLEYGQQLLFSTRTGLICDEVEALEENAALQFDEGQVIAPGFIELQTNGVIGIHFTTLGLDRAQDEENLRRVSREMARNGVTSWYATIPTVSEDRWKQILPILRPRSFSEVGGSPLLGAHVEGPYLHPAKKGAHNEEFFKIPTLHKVEDIYGVENLKHVIKLITLAPELQGALDLIKHIRSTYPHIVVSIGHSTASYETGVSAVLAGATCLTHVFNAMNPLHHREPGLAGLTAIAPSSGVQPPYFSLIPDQIHLHPNIVRMSYLSNPDRAVFITDSIELAGLPDGIYPPNGQITYPQRKSGNKATNVPTTADGKETLIGSCITLPEGIRNLVNHCGINVAQAVQCVSENIARLMNDDLRGELSSGKRADFVVLDKECNVVQTWIGGRKVFDVMEQDVLQT